MKKVIKTIGIDARFYGPVGKGLGRYTQEIVDYLTKNDSEHNYVIFLGKQNFADFVIDNPRITKVLADVKWYGLAEQIVMPRLIKQNKIDLMHFPHFNVPVACPVKFVVTVHDLILTKYPTVRATTLSPWFYQLKNIAYKIVIRLAIMRAQKIITVSEFTKIDIVKYFKIKPERIVVTYEGVAKLKTKISEINTQEDKSLLDLKIVKPFLLYVGNAYPHKNLIKLLTVVKHLFKHHDLQLVLVGKIDYFYQKLVALVSKWPKMERERIIFTGYVSDDGLEQLYRNALIYVFPSLYEGFGLPPLEAMARNCPVVSSDRSSMPEILGSAALYFDPEKDNDIFQQLELVIVDSDLRKKMIKAGVEQVKIYDWGRCAQLTLEVYKTIL